MLTLIDLVMLYGEREKGNSIVHCQNVSKVQSYKYMANNINTTIILFLIFSKNIALYSVQFIFQALKC